jgi:hypothetical protein
LILVCVCVLVFVFASTNGGGTEQAEGSGVKGLVVAPGAAADSIRTTSEYVAYAIQYTGPVNRIQPYKV